MSDASRMWGLAALLVIGIQACNPHMAKANTELRAAAALLKRFETLFYSKAGLLSGSDPDSQVLTMGRHDNPLPRPFLFFSEGLDSLGNGKQSSAEILRNAEAVLVGAKDFRSPAGFGAVRSQRCYVVILRKGSTLDLKNHFGNTPVASAAGAPVWNWSAMLGEFGEDDPRPSSLYATQVAHLYLMVSNNLEELQKVAELLASPDAVTRTLDEIPEWEFVHQQKIWGYRIYRHTEVVDPGAAALSYVSASAKALILLVDLKRRTSVVRLLTAPADERTAASINERAVLPPLKPLTPGVWEAIIPLAGDFETRQRLVDILYLFGFGAAV